MKPIKIKENGSKWDYKVSTPQKYDGTDYWRKRVLTINEVAAMFQCSIAQVINFIKEEGLPCKQVGYVKLFSVDQVLDWVEGKTK
jgi:hypothetical protein